MADWDILKTREGSSPGRSIENRMLDKAGGANGIRTIIQMHPDGSQTRLKTRGGAPEFVTIPAKRLISDSSVCLHGLYRNGYMDGLFKAQGGLFVFNKNSASRDSAKYFPPTNGDTKIFDGKYLISGSNNRFCLNGTIVRLGENSWLLKDGDSIRQCILPAGFTITDPGSWIGLKIFDTIRMDTDPEGVAPEPDGAIIIHSEIPPLEGNQILHVCDVTKDGRRILLSLVQSSYNSDFAATLPEVPAADETAYSSDPFFYYTQGRLYDEAAWRVPPTHEMTITGSWPTFAISVQQLIGGDGGSVLSFTAIDDSHFPVPAVEYIDGPAVAMYAVPEYFVPLGEVYEYSGGGYVTIDYEFNNSAAFPPSFVGNMPGNIVSRTICGFFYDDDDVRQPVYTVLTSTMSNTTGPYPGSHPALTAEIAESILIGPHSASISINAKFEIFFGTSGEILQEANDTISLITSGRKVREVTDGGVVTEKYFEIDAQYLTGKFGGRFSRISSKVYGGGVWGGNTFTTDGADGTYGGYGIVTVYFGQPTTADIWPSSAYDEINRFNGRFVFVTPDRSITTTDFNVGDMDPALYMIHASWHPNSTTGVYRTGNEQKFSFDRTRIRCWV